MKSLAVVLVICAVCFVTNIASAQKCTITISPCLSNCDMSKIGKEMSIRGDTIFITRVIEENCALKPESSLTTCEIKDNELHLNTTYVFGATMRCECSFLMQGRVIIPKGVRLISGVKYHATVKEVRDDEWRGNK